MSSCVIQTKRVLMTGHDHLLVMHIWIRCALRHIFKLIGFLFGSLASSTRNLKPETK